MTPPKTGEVINAPFPVQDTREEVKFNEKDLVVFAMFSSFVSLFVKLDDHSAVVYSKRLVKKKLVIWQLIATRLKAH
jgi:hypothetical protein